ncbi:hypothetical protein [Streptomyces microflavus]|uniref:hypothetical protein n=1 Tax=Streptomyces microflavus TaxID=1919 RepID=UPI003B213748
MTAPAAAAAHRVRHPTQAAYLQAVRQDAPREAATHIGVNRIVPARYARADREFGVLLDEAKAVGAKVREEGIPHDEYRYNILGCRCTDCGLAARIGRTERRTDTKTGKEENPGGTSTRSALKGLLLSLLFLPSCWPRSLEGYRAR